MEKQTKTVKKESPKPQKPILRHYIGPWKTVWEFGQCGLFQTLFINEHGNMMLQKDGENRSVNAQESLIWLADVQAEEWWESNEPNDAVVRKWLRMVAKYVTGKGAENMAPVHKAMGRES